MLIQCTFIIELSVQNYSPRNLVQLQNFLKEDKMYKKGYHFRNLSGYDDVKCCLLEIENFLFPSFLNTVHILKPTVNVMEKQNRFKQYNFGRITKHNFKTFGRIFFKQLFALTKW